MMSGSQVKEPVSSPAQKEQPAQAALLERVCRLEEQHRHDRRLWEEQLKEERRARREDARVLREAMHSFYKFMEREVPQKFAAVDDKTDSLLDHVSRLEERIGIIDDSTIALETRVSDLESDDADSDDDVHENHDDEIESEDMDEEKPIEKDERNPKRAGRKWPTTHKADMEQRASSLKLNGVSQAEDACHCDTSMAPPKRPVASPSHSGTSVSKSPQISHCNSATDAAFPVDLIEAHAPNTGAHTYVHKLTSPPCDFVTSLISQPETPPYTTILNATTIHTVAVPLIKPPRPRSNSAMKDMDQKYSACQQQVSKAYPSPEENVIGPYCELPNPPSRKRKLDAEGRYDPETRQRSIFISMPPPLSLSGPDLKV
ncbi:hypothetical protein EMCG_00950 [[Emmonsia] crescens]|uniref:Uncharacterized protein n=1 Tax=[Emmonsia] crescens TaxID=73230 RepID=A0A0G2HNE7_9EURO|nr:hypothetical protein EMCG_00950 [Emmonsia crescens UAMH 3008]